MTATFGIQGAHADGADEFEAPLADVPSAGLNGVDRVVGGVSHRESRRNQEISFSTHAGSSWEDPGRLSHQRSKKSDA